MQSLRSRDESLHSGQAGGFGEHRPVMTFLRFVSVYNGVNLPRGPFFLPLGSDVF